MVTDLKWDQRPPLLSGSYEGGSDAINALK
jgi:hypothetical protein